MRVLKLPPFAMSEMGLPRTAWASSGGMFCGRRR